MAELKLEKETYVKWPVSGGQAIGKILNLGETVSSVELPSGALAEVKVESLTAISDEEYDNSVASLVDNLVNRKKTRKSKIQEESMSKANTENAANVSDSNAEETKALQAKYDEAVKAKAELEAKFKEMEKEVECARTEAAKFKMDFEKANSELEAAQKAATAKERFSKIKEVDGVATLAETDEAAIAALVDMDDKTFGIVLKAATVANSKVVEAGQSGQPKSTDQSKSNLPKLTDQSKTSETKLTQAEDKSEASTKAIESAKVEEDVTLVTASEGENNELKNALSAFASSSLKFGAKKESK